jgi:hypothetical protein
MKIEAFAPSETRARMADWVELTLVMSQSASVSDAAVEGARHLLDDAEHSEEVDELSTDGEKYDSEILEPAVEARREALWNEFMLRTSALGNAYPFVLTATAQGGWRLGWRDSAEDADELARDVYIAALIMASFRNRLVSKPAEADQARTDLVKRIPELFQSVSVLAATNLLSDAYWFGWPRHTPEKFVEALATVRDLIGLGKLKAPPEPTTYKKKDGTVDLIAWRTFRDGMYGALILYGQVASGSNWVDKPLSGSIKGNFLFHFIDHPGEYYLESIFIPFVAHDDVQDVPGHGLDATITSASCARERDFGIVVDRLRITELLAEGLPADARMHNSPAGRDVVTRLQKWVDDCRAYVAA